MRHPPEPQPRSTELLEALPIARRHTFVATPLVQAGVLYPPYHHRLHPMLTTNFALAMMTLIATSHLLPVPLAHVLTNTISTAFTSRLAPSLLGYQSQCP